MPVIRGDRIGESRRLNQRSIQAQTFYALFAAAVPDDFGRFRVSTQHIFLAMYPRREPTPRLLKWVLEMVHELGTGDDPLWISYEVDGQMFGEFVNWKPTGNLYHRAPEPPWSQHVHTKRCAKTAMARAKEWGQPQEVERLSNLINNLTTRKPEQAPISNDTGGGTAPEPPSIRQSVYPSTRTEIDIQAVRPANPLVDRGALVAEGHQLIRDIAKIEPLDPTEILRKASDHRGKGYVRLDVMQDDRLAHTVIDLRRWLRKLTGQTEPQPPPPANAQKAASVDVRNTDALQRFMDRRRDAAGRGEGDGVREGAGTDRKGLPPGSR
jgi:hypothetical protein